MFFDIGIFILVFLHVAYLLLCTCQKWRNKDVQSIKNYDTIYRYLNDFVGIKNSDNLFSNVKPRLLISS